MSVARMCRRICLRTGLFSANPAASGVLSLLLVLGESESLLIGRTGAFECGSHRSEAGRGGVLPSTSEIRRSWARGRLERDGEGCEVEVGRVRGSGVGLERDFIEI